jgi:NADPH:quinone reductase-like Zn-dependent oxidoreductase
VNGALTLRSVSGGFAEILSCAAARLVRVPDGIDDVAAAAIQMSYGTAWHMLHARAGLRSGDVVLVSSVGSGLGSAAADIARLAGARVIATASTDEKLAIARARGVDEVINHARSDVAAEVARLTDGVGVDIAFEHVGGDAFAAALASLAMDGRLVTCGWTAAVLADIDLMDLCRGRKQIIGSVNRRLEDLHRCLELAACGRLNPAIAATFPLERVRDAVALAESRTAFGKVVVTP